MEWQLGGLNDVLKRAKAVCLIVPPSAFLLDERVFVSLGILKVASTLESRGHCVTVLDLSGIRNYVDALSAYLKSAGDDVIGLTATTPQLPAVFSITKVIRELRPDLKLILGGPHVTLTHAAVKLERKLGSGKPGRATRAARILEDTFDVLVAGDGELAVLRALDHDAPKVIDGDDHKGEFFMSSDFYSDSPPPARHLVDLRSYRYWIEGHTATSLIAQLGCPFGCGFCGGRSSKSLRVIRTRSIESIVKEMEAIHRTYGYTGFMFYDDELNISKSMTELMNAITDLQMRLGVEFRLRGFVKAELFTDAQAEAMYRAGFRWLLCGFEAANPRILQNIQKRATCDDNSRAVEIARRHNLKVKALMSIGHPGESERSALDVSDWLIRMQVDDFDCTIITTYPGTPYYDYAVPHELGAGCLDVHAAANWRSAACLRDRLHYHTRLLQGRSGGRLQVLCVHRPPFIRTARSPEKSNRSGCADSVEHPIQPVAGRLAIRTFDGSGSAGLHPANKRAARSAVCVASPFTAPPSGCGTDGRSGVSRSRRDRDRRKCRRSFRQTAWPRSVPRRRGTTPANDP